MRQPGRWAAPPRPSWEEEPAKAGLAGKGIALRLRLPRGPLPAVDRHRHQPLLEEDHRRGRRPGRDPQGHHLRRLQGTAQRRPGQPAPRSSASSSPLVGTLFSHGGVRAVRLRPVPRRVARPPLDPDDPAGDDVLRRRASSRPICWCSRLGLTDTYLALILPSAVSVFNILVLRGVLHGHLAGTHRQRPHRRRRRLAHPAGRS